MITMIPGLISARRLINKSGIIANFAWQMCKFCLRFYKKKFAKS